MDYSTIGGDVQVEIGELLVEAGQPYRADVVARAVEEHLARLLAGSGLPAELLHDREIGAAIARAVHTALVRERAG